VWFLALPFPPTVNDAIVIDYKNVNVVEMHYLLSNNIGYLDADRQQVVIIP
jgi:hypothetical protein